jgi:hypothetical protein
MKCRHLAFLLLVGLIVCRSPVATGEEETGTQGGLSMRRQSGLRK